MVEEIGKNKGFLLILEKREAGIVYAPDTIDLTDQVIQRFNAEYAGQGSAGARQPKP